MTVSDDIQRIFTYQSPKPEHVEAMKAIRARACELAQTIVDKCPPSADRTAAIRKLREAVMTANASIVLEGKDVSGQPPRPPTVCKCLNRGGSMTKCADMVNFHSGGSTVSRSTCECKCHGEKI